MSYIPLSGACIAAYQRLPLWMRSDLIFSECAGFIYSGNRLLGWSWVTNLKNSRMKGYHLEPSGDELIEGANIASVWMPPVIPSEPGFYIPFLKLFLSDLAKDIEFDISREKDFGLFGGIKILISFSHNAESVSLVGYGGDCLEAFLNLCYEASEFYWVNMMPSIKDMDIITKISGETMGAAVNHYPHLEPEPCDIDLFEGPDGSMCVSIDSYSATAKFMRSYSSFRYREQHDIVLRTEARHYHGTLSMMEGDIKIYSNYSVDVLDAVPTIHFNANVSGGYEYSVASSHHINSPDTGVGVSCTYKDIVLSGTVETFVAPDELVINGSDDESKVG